MRKTTSIAVLPFKNMSNDPENEFFCEGMSEEIIHALSKVEQLQVISRTSSFYFKNHVGTLQEIGDRLGVNILLEGSVRLSGNKMRISAQLIKVDEDLHFWSQVWDRKLENLFEIQDEISLLIADKLREHLGHMDISPRLTQTPTEDVFAYKHLMKGRYHFAKWNPQNTHIAIREFEQAIAIDDKLIEAHLGLADCYSFLAVAGFAPREEAWAKATSAIDIAKRIDANHAGLNYMLAHQAFFIYADFATAMKCVSKALASVPTHADSQRLISFLYILNGSQKKAKDHIFYAKSIDPLNPETLFYEAYYHYRTSALEHASLIIESLLEENDKNLPALIVKVYLKIKENNLDEARELIESAPEELFTPDERLGLLTLIEVSDHLSESPHLEALITHAQEPSAHHAHSYLFMALAILGKLEEAFAVLDNLFTHKSSILLLAFSDPLAENIQKDPTYEAYHRKIYPSIQAESPVVKPKVKRPDKATIQKQLTKLKTYVEIEKPFLNPTLSLRLLAEHINIHPNHLSWLLNEHIGKNFNEFINQERISHFKKLVVDPANSHISLVGLAYESGFNSKTVFNTAFKKETGMTPKAYQKSQL